MGKTRVACTGHRFEARSRPRRFNGQRQARFGAAATAEIVCASALPKRCDRPAVSFIDDRTPSTS